MITSGQLGTFLQASDFVTPRTQITLFDSEYSLFAKSWVFATLYPSFVTSQKAIGLWGWRENIWDCDKYARAFANWAALSHAKYGKIKTATAIGVFVYNMYVDDFSYTHAINIGIERKNGVLAAYFLEPQNGSEVILKPEEKETCAHIFI